MTDVTVLRGRESLIARAASSLAFDVSLLSIVDAHGASDIAHVSDLIQQLRERRLAGLSSPCTQGTQSERGVPPSSLPCETTMLTSHEMPLPHARASHRDS